MSRLCLMGKVLGNKAANKEGLERVVSSVWQIPHRIRVEQLGFNNIFIFHFGSVED